MAKEKKQTESSSFSFPIFSIFSIIVAGYLVILALGINIPYLNMIPQKIGLIIAAVMLILNMLKGSGELKDYKKKLVKGIEKN